MKRFDAIVIGAGQAGPSLAVRLAKAGQSVAVIERKFLGGTCVNTGCMPTKTLVASARAAHVARTAAHWGVEVGGPVTVDMKRVKERARAVTMRSRKGLEDWLRGSGVTIVEGHARFIAPDSVRVGEEVFAAPSIFINTGARAAVPAIDGIAHVPYLTNVSALELEEVPKHLVIVGGGPIGLELGQVYRRFGAAVTIIDGGARLLPREDEAVGDAVHAILEGEGIELRLGARPAAVSSDPAGVKLVLASGDTVVGSHLLLAAGRRPNTDDLGLEAAGVAIDGRGHIVVDDELRTSVPGIWALGEANGRGNFTHTAYNDFEVVAANLDGGEPRKVTDRIEAYAIYIDPPLARAGLDEAAARASTTRKYLVAERPMTRVGRAVEKGETQGFLRAVVEAETLRVVGATILGIEADEAIHALLYAMYAGATAKTVTRSVGIHPTVSELLPTLLSELRPLE